MWASLARDGEPAFGVHAFVWAGDWAREGSERVISAAGLAFLRAKDAEHEMLA